MTKQRLVDVCCRSWAWLFIATASMLTGVAHTQTFTNPIFASQDPWITYVNGIYYYSESYCGAATICIKAATTLTGLSNATWVGVWNPPTGAINSGDVWAPELHYINGQWYFYYAADNGNNDTHRLFILQANSSNPLGSYSMANTGAPNGQLTESTGNWAIDPDVFTAADGNMYVAWSCTNNPTSAGNQNICLARMLDPLHTTSGTVMIAQPTQAWEQRTAPIEEGPIGYVRNGKTYITYSASASWVNNAYCAGLLTNTTVNVLNASAWTKQGPIFDHHGTAYGPGSVVFIQSVDGHETWNLYHGFNSLRKHSGRSIRMQKMYWSSDDTPVLGYPVNPGVALAVPSGEQGYTGTGSVLSDWGNAYGDAAEGNTADGTVVGSWAPIDRYTNRSISLGAGWHQNFSGWNPNFQNYTLNASLQWVQTGMTSSSPKYGVYAAYSNVKNYASVWIDIKNGVVASYAVVNGTAQSWADCPLPPGFVPSNANTLQIQKTGSVFDISLNGTALAGACTGRSFSLLNGQIGLMTEDTEANYSNVTVTNTY
jgi:GH43 family beta-xylosidase